APGWLSPHQWRCINWPIIVRSTYLFDRCGRVRRDQIRLGVFFLFLCSRCFSRLVTAASGALTFGHCGLLSVRSPEVATILISRTAQNRRRLQRQLFRLSALTFTVHLFEQSDGLTFHPFRNRKKNVVTLA